MIRHTSRFVTLRLHHWLKRLGTLTCFPLLLCHAIQAAPPELATAGNQIVVKSTGQVVRLTGVNIPSLGWGNGEYLNESLTEATSNWNCNIIRLPVKGSSWLNSSTYRGIVDNFITQASALDVYVILDLHHFGYVKPADVTFWADAADHFKNNPAVLFGLLNEPHGINWDEWLNGYNGNPGMQDLVDTVRATGANNIMLAGGLEYSFKLGGIIDGYALTESTSGNGIVYDSHVYPLKSYITENVINCAQIYPVLLGEFGHPGGTTFIGFSFEHHSTWVPKYLDWVDLHRLHWTGWCLHPSAAPNMIEDWNFTPTSYWGQAAKNQLLTYADPTAMRTLGGTVIGTTGTSLEPNSGELTDWRAGAMAPYMTTSDLHLYFRAPTANGAWTGFDLIEPQVVQQIAFAPRKDYGSLMVGGEFQASSTADFSSDVHTLHTITTAPIADGETLTTVTISAPDAYRYVRYLGPDGAYCNVAFIRFYGIPESSDPAQPVTTWNLQFNQSGYNNWNMLSDWFSQTTGGGANPTVLSPLDTFDANNYILRSKAISSGEDAFDGGAIRLTSSSGRLYLKAFNTASSHAPRIIMDGGQIIAASGGNQQFDVGRIEVEPGNHSLHASSTRTIDLWAASLEGSGTLKTTDYGTVALSIMDASGFTGVIDHLKGTLELNPLAYGRPFAMAGELKVANNASVTLNNDVYVGALAIDGVAYSDGTYTASALGFSGTGDLTVQSASGTWHLPANQWLANNWNMTSDWFSQAGSGGVNPNSLSPLDFYQVDSVILRSSNINTGEDAFGGGTIALTGSNGRLYLKAYANAISYASRLELNGGQIIAASGGVQMFDVARIDANSGQSALSASSGRTIDLWVGTLQGSGDLKTNNVGTIALNIMDATDFTGAFNHNTGTLVFEPQAYGRPFAMSGTLNVATGASVTLNNDVYLTGLDIAGTPIAPGTYTATALGFAGTGSLTVQALSNE